MNISDQMSGIYAVVLAVKDLDSACRQYAALGQHALKAAEEEYAQRKKAQRKR